MKLLKALDDRKKCFFVKIDNNIYSSTDNVDIELENHIIENDILIVTFTAM